MTFVSLIPDYISIIPKLLIVCYAKTGHIVNSGGKPLNLFALNKGPLPTSKIDLEDILIHSCSNFRPFCWWPPSTVDLFDDGTGTKFALKSEHNGLFVGVNEF